jgi:uncharacterized membrane protein
MQNFIIKYFSVLIPFLLIDGVWLGFVAKNVYQKYLSDLMTKTPNILAAVLFYILYPIGVVVFVLNTNTKDTNLIRIFSYGLLFGLLCYSTYDLTNLATLKNWPVIVTVIDIIWGSLLTGVVGVIAFTIASKLIK